MLLQDRILQAFLSEYSRLLFIKFVELFSYVLISRYTFKNPFTSASIYNPVPPTYMGILPLSIMSFSISLAIFLIQKSVEIL